MEKVVGRNGKDRRRKKKKWILLDWINEKRRRRIKEKIRGSRKIKIIAT